MLDDWIDQHRRLMREFVNGNPTVVSIHRPQYQGDGAGGRHKVDHKVLADQRIRLLEREVRGSDSQTALLTDLSKYLAIAPHDADIKENDTFQDERGVWYIVTKIMPQTTIRIRAEVHPVDDQS